MVYALALGASAERLASSSLALGTIKFMGNIESMKIFVVVKAHAKEDSVEKIDALNYRVSVKAPPVDGKANEAVEKLMADLFNVPSKLVRVLKGHTSKKKIVEVRF